ncbi:hypothetical protein [Duncaniella muris]|uniref:hypothetical protein n=1 Tax=Duncaniella muris TaxID=2094150 RepID=UPI003F666C79
MSPSGLTTATTDSSMILSRRGEGHLLYNVGGLLEKSAARSPTAMTTSPSSLDKFEQRSYLKYWQRRGDILHLRQPRPLSNLAVNSGGTSLMDNAYTFDAVSNVLLGGQQCFAPRNGNCGGQMSTPTHMTVSIVSLPLTGTIPV